MPDIAMGVGAAVVAGKWLNEDSSNSVGAVPLGENLHNTQTARDTATTGASPSGGRLGGPEHQAVTGQIVKDINNSERGLTAYKEYKVDTPGGRKPYRFVDVAALDVNGNPVEFHQVGQVTQGGVPVARERYAIIDISELSRYGDVPIHYHPYYKR